MKTGYFETKFRILCNLCRLCSDCQCGIMLSGLCYISLYPLLFMFLKVMLMIVCSQFGVIVNIYIFFLFFSVIRYDIICKERDNHNVKEDKRISTKDRMVLQFLSLFLWLEDQQNFWWHCFCVVVHMMLKEVDCIRSWRFPMSSTVVRQENLIFFSSFLIFKVTGCIYSIG